MLPLSVVAVVLLGVPSPLERYFDSIHTGPGLWKWRHYFPFYHQHFDRFVNLTGGATVAEVGVFSGGSLKMWRHYFGKKATIYGIDIAPSVMQFHLNHRYGSPQMFVGSQSNVTFWNEFKSKTMPLDIFMDDGSHKGDDQLTTFKAVWPHLKKGGIYWVEDIVNPATSRRTKLPNAFVDYTAALTQANFSASSIRSIHIHRSIIVIEKEHEETPYYNEKHGTVWQPDSFWRSGGKQQTQG